MRRLRVQIWDETNEAEHWAPVSLTGKFRYYVLLSASNRCRTSPLWVGHIAHKQDQEEACDCSILCVSSKPSVSLLILNISWTILDDAGVPHFKKKHIITGDVLKAVWERLSHFSSVLWSLWPRCCPLPAAARMQPLLRLQLRLLGLSKLGDLGADPGTILLHALRHMWLSSTEFHYVPLVAESQAETAEVVTSLVWTQGDKTMIQNWGPEKLVQNCCE